MSWLIAQSICIFCDIYRYNNTCIFTLQPKTTNIHACEHFPEYNINPLPYGNFNLLHTAALKEFCDVSIVNYANSAKIKEINIPGYKLGYDFNIG